MRSSTIDGDFLDPLGDRIVGEARLVLAVSLGMPIALICLFTFTPILPEWVSIIYIACALIFLFIANITIPISKSASIPRKLFPFSSQVETRVHRKCDARHISSLIGDQPSYCV